MKTAIEVIASAHRALDDIACPVAVTSETTAVDTPAGRSRMRARLQDGRRASASLSLWRAAARPSHGHESPAAGFGVTGFVSAVSTADSWPPMSRRKGGYWSVISVA